MTNLHTVYKSLEYNRDIPPLFNRVVSKNVIMSFISTELDILGDI